MTGTVLGLAMSSESYRRNDLTKSCGVYHRHSKRGAIQLLWLQLMGFAGPLAPLKKSEGCQPSVMSE